MKFVIYIEIYFEFHWKQAHFQSSFSHCKMNWISQFWNYFGKSQFTDMLQHIFASGLVSYNFCMIPLACAWNFGCTNSEFSKSHCKSAFPELLHPKSWVQTSGIIQKLYETKPDAYMRFCISVTWLFPQIIPKMWDSVHFTVWNELWKQAWFQWNSKQNSM